MVICLSSRNWIRIRAFRALYKWGSSTSSLRTSCSAFKSLVPSLLQFYIVGCYFILAFVGTIGVDWNLCNFGKRTRGKALCFHCSFKEPFLRSSSWDVASQEVQYLGETIIFTLAIWWLSRRNKILTPQGTPSCDCSSIHTTRNSILWNEQRDWIIVSVIISAAHLSTLDLLLATCNLGANSTS